MNKDNNFWLNTQTVRFYMKLQDDSDWEFARNLFDIEYKRWKENGGGSS
jgi:hypothetical protein